MRRLLLAILAVAWLMLPTVANAESYGPAPEQTIEVTTLPGERTPDGTDGWPWVMTVHGGSWAAGSTVNTAKARDVFSNAGFVVFNVEYRKITDFPGRPAVTFADQRQDILDALDWVHDHAAEYGADPDRGAIYGFSAGGHLAAAAGLYGDGHRVRAIVSASGVLQPHRIIDVMNSDPDVGWAGDKPTENTRLVAQWESVAMRCPMVPWSDCAARWADFKPETHISPGDPPIFMTQGTADPAVPAQTPRAFKWHMNRAGVEAELVECINWGHTEACALDGGVRQTKLINWVRAHTL